MPFYKFVSNRFLTLVQNILINQKLSEYHTGYRGFSANVLRSINYNRNSNDFVFDNQMLAQNNRPTKASSINFKRSIVYGLGVISTSFSYLLQKVGIAKFAIFASPEKRISLLERNEITG